MKIRSFGAALAAVMALALAVVGAPAFAQSSVQLPALPQNNSPAGTDLVLEQPTGTVYAKYITLSQIGSFVQGLVITGSGTPGDCASFLTSTSIQDSGVPCGSVAGQVRNTVFAGPASGGVATPTFRPLVAADIPALSYISSLASGTCLTGGPITSTGTLALDLTCTPTLTGLWTFNGGADVTPAGCSDVNAVGYQGMPVNNQTGSYTLACSDDGKVIVANCASACTITIPANASIAFKAKSMVDIISIGAGAVTVAITSDTLDWGNSGSISTGSRTLATGATVSLVKIGTTTWFIAGGGIS